MSAATSWWVRYLQAVGIFAAVIALFLLIGATVEAVPRVSFLPQIVQGILIGAGYIAAAIGVFLVITQPTAAMARSMYIDSLLGAGRCAACGYAIGAHRGAEADGCVVCGECGAAWRSDRVATVTVAEASWSGVQKMRAQIRGEHQHAAFTTDATGRRVAVSSSIRLPKTGPWAWPTRCAFSIGSLFAALFVASVVCAAAGSVVVVVVSVIASHPSDEAAQPLRALGVVIAMAFGVPFPMLVAVAVALTVCRVLRAQACLAARVCPSCDTALGDRGDHGRCAACGARWRVDDRAGRSNESSPRGGASSS
ncbi:MAG: hypothetical protein U0572_07255 [Phycisphaerales bacterium]